MTKLNSYLNFDGNAEEAFNFYKCKISSGVIISAALKINTGYAG